MLSGLGVVWLSGRRRFSVGVASQRISAPSGDSTPRRNLERDEEEVHTGLRRKRRSQDWGKGKG